MKTEVNTNVVNRTWRLEERDTGQGVDFGVRFVDGPTIWDGVPDWSVYFGGQVPVVICRATKKVVGDYTLRELIERQHGKNELKLSWWDKRCRRYEVMRFVPEYMDDVCRSDNSMRLIFTAIHSFYDRYAIYLQTDPPDDVYPEKGKKNDG